MAVTNIACPYCGKETLATIPSDKKLKGVKQYSHTTRGDTEAACNECGEKIAVYYK